jgi:hypothetical protein
MTTTVSALQLHILLWQREIVRRAQRAAALATIVTHTEGTTMSCTTHSYANRMLAVAGFLGMATLVAPAATHAQITSPERAYSEHTAFSSYSKVPVAAEPSRTADGELALLGRSAVDVTRLPKMAVGTLRDARRVDGEQALLNEVKP